MLELGFVEFLGDLDGIRRSSPQELKLFKSYKMRN